MEVNISLNQKNVSKYFTSFDVPLTATIRINTSKFVCNSIILALHSSVFEAQIYSGQEEFYLENSIFNFPGCEKLIREFILYLHGDNLILSLSNIPHCCVFACKFDFRELQKQCFSFIDVILTKMPTSIFQLYPIKSLICAGEFQDRISTKYLEHIRDYNDEILSYLLKEIDSDQQINVSSELIEVLVENGTSDICGTFLLSVWEKCPQSKSIIMNMIEDIPYERVFSDTRSFNKFIDKMSQQNSKVIDNDTCDKLVQLQNMFFLKTLSMKNSDHNVSETDGLSDMFVNNVIKHHPPNNHGYLNNGVSAGIHISPEGIVNISSNTSNKLKKNMTPYDMGLQNIPSPDTFIAGLPKNNTPRSNKIIADLLLAGPCLPQQTNGHPNTPILQNIPASQNTPVLRRTPGSNNRSSMISQKMLSDVMKSSTKTTTTSGTSIPSDKSSWVMEQLNVQPGSHVTKIKDIIDPIISDDTEPLPHLLFKENWKNVQPENHSKKSKDMINPIISNDAEPLPHVLFKESWKNMTLEDVLTHIETNRGPLIYTKLDTIFTLLLKHPDIQVDAKFHTDLLTRFNANIVSKYYMTDLGMILVSHATEPLPPVTIYPEINTHSVSSNFTRAELKALIELDSCIFITPTEPCQIAGCKIDKHINLIKIDLNASSKCEFRYRIEPLLPNTICHKGHVLHYYILALDESNQVKQLISLNLLSKLEILHFIKMYPFFSVKVIYSIDYCAWSHEYLKLFIE